MLSLSIIVFREILEIALVLGVLMAATGGVRFARRLMAGGIAAGILGSLALAYFAETISGALQGTGQEVFNATVLFVAAGLIGWTVVWMRRHGRMLARRFKEVGSAITRGESPLYSLAIVTLLATLREGSEIVLFTYGVLASGEDVTGVVIGSSIGLVLGALAGAVLYYGLIRISTRTLFSTTGWLLIFLAAGMVSQGAALLASAGILPEIVSPLWDTSGVLSESSGFGQLLHTLLGYSQRPSGLQFLVYLATVLGLVLLMKQYGRQPFSSEQKETE